MLPFRRSRSLQPPAPRSFPSSRQRKNSFRKYRVDGRFSPMGSTRDSVTIRTWPPFCSKSRALELRTTSSLFRPLRRHQNLPHQLHTELSSSKDTTLPQNRDQRRNGTKISGFSCIGTSVKCRYAGILRFTEAQLHTSKEWPTGRRRYPPDDIKRARLLLWVDCR